MSEQVSELDAEYRQRAKIKERSIHRFRSKKWKTEAMKPLYLARYE
jgi:hypothetical protein